MPAPPKNQPLDSKTLAYEFKMLCGTAWRLTGVNHQTEWVLYNALVESFAIHCRNLLAFFFGHDPASGFLSAGKSPRGNDVLATDFCPSWAEPWDATIYGVAKEQADKHVAHIVTQRQEMNYPGGPTSDWDTQSLLPRFVALMEKFLAATQGKLGSQAEVVLRDTVAKFKQHPSSQPAQPQTPYQAANAPATGQKGVTKVNTVPPPTGYSMSAKSAPPDTNPDGSQRW